MRPPFFYRMTDGIRVTVRPEYLEERSIPSREQYVFAYHVRLENVGERAARLLRRHWHIHDDAAGDTEVEGEGVVGEQPRLQPGTSHQYSSFCVLTTLSGWMEGTYTFVRDDGAEFEVVIPRFVFDARSGSAET